MKNLILAYIKAEFKRRGITQKQVADDLGKSPSTISNMLTGGNVSLKKLDEIFVRYGIVIDKIIFK